MSQGFTKEYPQPATGSLNVLVNGTVQATTSGSSYTMTGLPSGIKRFSVVLNGVTPAAGSGPLIKLRTGGASVSTGYDVRAQYITDGGGASPGNDLFDFTGAFGVYGSTEGVTGTWEFVLMDSATNTWAGNFQGHGSSGTFFTSTGIVSLSGELDGIELLQSASTFSAGSFNIQYDNPNLVGGDTVYVAGGVVQTVHAQDGEVATTTTLLPYDDTIVQNTEGAEFISATITPKAVNNKLRIDVVVPLSHSAAPCGIMASLFQDSTADSLKTMALSQHNAYYNYQMSMTHWMDAGTTSSTTFKVRAGGNIAGTLTINGAVSARRFGGTMPLSITITEYAA